MVGLGVQGPSAGASERYGDKFIVVSSLKNEGKGELGFSNTFTLILYIAPTNKAK